ncbi:MAG TPA: hypothetical protein VNZ45_16575 [Bacteroidia bacterium]|nr:hypothetical protein [Bacteroidia bacterium]
MNDSFFIRTTPFYYVYRLSAKPINTDTIFKPWKCVGVFKDNSEFEGGYKLIMKEDGQVVNVEPSRVIRYDTSQILIKKYGVSDFYLILQGAINKGWTKQMVILSIGKPTKEEYKESIYYWIYGSDEDIQTYYYFNSSGHLMSMATD